MKDEILEEDYQKIKKMLNKKDDYFSEEELKNLMQFLMQRQDKVIKNEVKRDKVWKNIKHEKCFK